MKKLLFLLTGLTFLFGCAHTPPVKMETLSGTLFYRERMMLPPNAEITVKLEEVSKMDVAAEVIASTTLRPKGGPPYAFILEYDPSKISDKGRYGLRVRIEADDKLMFINTRHVPAFEEPLDIMVSRVREHKVPDASLTGTYWKPVELNNGLITLGEGQRELHLILRTGSNQAKGFSGCNQFSGGYERDGPSLDFGSLISTLMAGPPESMEQEQQFLLALKKTVRFKISGDNLTLYNAENEVVLRFEAVYLGEHYNLIPSI